MSNRPIGCYFYCVPIKENIVLNECNFFVCRILIDTVCKCINSYWAIFGCVDANRILNNSKLCNSFQNGPSGELLLLAWCTLSVARKFMMQLPKYEVSSEKVHKIKIVEIIVM